MRDKKNIIIAVISILLFFAYNVSYSQTNNEIVPVFILQGTVKLKGKPVNGVTLSLMKDGKQVAKIITPRNGLYYFQLNKSDSDPQTEYQLNIEKESISTGVLKVNTYIPKEQFTVVPYMFNLDFNLTVPDNSGIIKKRDFGKIRWMADRNVFDFDKEYDLIVEQEMKRADSTRYAAEQAQLAKKEDELKNKPDSLVSTMTTDTSKIEKTTSLTSVKTTNTEKATIEKESQNTNSQSGANPITEKTGMEKTTIATQESGNQEKNGKEQPIATVGKTVDEKKMNKGQHIMTNETGDQKKMDKEKQSAIIYESAKQKKTAGSNQTLTEKITTNTAGNNEKEKSQEAVSKKEITNKKTVEQEKNKSNETSKVSSGTINNLTGSKINTGSLKNMDSADSLSTSDTKEKDLFFLTGIPMEQFRRNLSSSDVNKKAGSFEAADVFFANNERSRLFNAKQKMERKKGENLAKKHETNNTLTSLMDMVEEFDKSNK